jgi:cellulose biosynthesis protein BcsQ
MANDTSAAVPATPAPAVPAAAALPAAASPTVSLFQKAHAKMVTLARIDEQLQTLLDQRKRLQDELRAVQTQINDEFDRVTTDQQATPAKLLAQIAVSASNPVAVPAKRNGNAKPSNRIEASV